MLGKRARRFSNRAWLAASFVALLTTRAGSDDTRLGPGSPDSASWRVGAPKSIAVNGGWIHRGGNGFPTQSDPLRLRLRHRRTSFVAVGMREIKLTRGMVERTPPQVLGGFEVCTASAGPQTYACRPRRSKDRALSCTLSFRASLKDDHGKGLERERNS